MNYMMIDGHLLRTFLTILEEGSVSRAAERLNLTQPAVSHALARLRKILGDPLFVRSGQGLVATERARSLRAPVQKALDSLKSLTDLRAFDPHHEDMRFAIAANDMQRDLIFPRLLHACRKDGIRLALEFAPSGVPTTEMLRQGKTQIVITPLPPDGPDIFQRRLFSGKMVCFYDGNVRAAPKTWEEYCGADHLSVKFASGAASSSILKTVDTGQLREPMIAVSNFNALAAFLRDSDLLATEVDLMRFGPLRDFAMAPLPFPSDPMQIFMVWHERDNNNPAHVWLRRRIEDAASEVNAEISAAPAR